MLKPNIFNPSPWSGVTVVPCAIGVVACIKLVAVPQLKPMHRFSPNFQEILPQDDLEPIRFLGGSSNNCCHGNTFKILGVLNFVGCPQPKSMHRFSPNFWDIFTPIGSRAYLVLGGILPQPAGTTF